MQLEHFRPPRKDSPERRKILIKYAEEFKEILTRYAEKKLAEHPIDSEEFKNRLSLFEERWEEFYKNYENLPDEEFERTYWELYEEIEELLRLISPNSFREYTVDFREDISKIKTLEDFVEEGPMYWIPRKEEIGRILSLAKQIHEERVKRGEKLPEDPILILDIGGANGTLGKLVTDLARENNINIQYIIVDPDTPTVEAAKSVYRDNPSLKFIEQTAEEFILELYKDNPELYPLIKKRKELIEDGEKLRRELIAVKKAINKDKHRMSPSYDAWAAEETIKMYVRILKEYFGIEIEEGASLSDTLNKLVNLVNDIKWDDEILCFKDFSDIYLDPFREEINSLTNRIEEIIMRLPPSFDLVICSWMPPGLDLTPLVRMANGGALVHILERYGATGLQYDVTFPSSSYPPLGQERSYQPGKCYTTRFGWIGYSTPEIRIAKRWGVEKFWENWDLGYPEGSINLLYGLGGGLLSGDPIVLPLSNGVIIQIKKGYEGSISSLDPEKVGIKVEGIYPWEEELTRKGGPLSPIIELKDREDGTLEYFPQFEELLQKLQEEFDKAQKLKRKRKRKRK